MIYRYYRAAGPSALASQTYVMSLLRYPECVPSHIPRGEPLERKISYQCMINIHYLLNRYIFKHICTILACISIYRYIYITCWLYKILCRCCWASCPGCWPCRRRTSCRLISSSPPPATSSTPRVWWRTPERPGIRLFSTRVEPDMFFFAGCRISGRIIWHDLMYVTGYLAFSCRITGYPAQPYYRCLYPSILENR